MNTDFMFSWPRASTCRALFHDASPFTDDKVAIWPSNGSEVKSELWCWGNTFGQFSFHGLYGVTTAIPLWQCSSKLKSIAISLWQCSSKLKSTAIYIWAHMPFGYSARLGTSTRESASPVDTIRLNSSNYILRRHGLKTNGDCGMYVIEHIEHSMLETTFDNVNDYNMKKFRERWCVDLFYENLA
ncbi:hypothetical protein F8388_016374 [Cannabis sativa]|uniref:Ubiquitin-like protease family profile domain-containing protein n=1 Tax=Cannabis sativa TaxID=3483 RepID=A0A7J6GT65_CANSA|nr:hypothetical protein F8388_016374 [Cannabis sativa]